eukprot:2677512-Heterocapsa_arctica.AAC.1
MEKIMDTETSEGGQPYSHKKTRRKSYFGARANKNAKERAEEIQKRINNQKRIDNIKAHQRTIIFEIPSIEENSPTDEQTNH